MLHDDFIILYRFPDFVLVFLFAQVCAISNEVLREPVAACQLGYLYNKVSEM